MRLISLTSRRRLWLAALCALSTNFHGPALADESGKIYPSKTHTLEDELRKSVLPIEDKSFLSLTIENDFFGSGTDQNYTSGLRLSYFKVGEKPPKLTKKLEHILPFFTVNDTTSVSYSIGQNLYTPDAVGSATQDPNDRPWAAFLYGSMGLTTVEKNHIDEVELTLGVVGPLAGGKPIQVGWHELINTTRPRGWNNQLDNEPGLMVSWQRRWPFIMQLSSYDRAISFTPHAGFTLGNIYTYANAGATIKYSLNGTSLSDRPVSVRPSVPGTGFFKPSSKVGAELFLSSEVRAIAHNIFLDGNTFTNSHSIDKEHFVADISGGIAFTLGHARLSYSLVWRSKEFEGQDSSDLFGAVSLGYNF